MESWIAEWNHQIKQALRRLVTVPDAAPLAVEMFERASSNPPPMIGVEAARRALEDEFTAHTGEWERSLDPGDATLLAQQIGRPVIGRRRGLPRGVAGHIRVVLVGERDATVCSLVVRCASGSAAASPLEQLYPAIGRANEALMSAQRDLISESSLLPRETHALLHELGGWTDRPELRGEPFGGLRELLERAGTIAAIEPRHIHEAAIDVCVQVGDPETGRDSRSIELPFALAAMSSVFDCPAADTLVVATGCLDADLRVKRVDHLENKMRAVLDWARARRARLDEQAPGRASREGRSERPIVQFLYPSDNHERLEGEDGAAWQRYVHAVPVRDLRAAWEAVRRPRPRLWSWAEPVFAAAIAVWYFERVAFGEYASDPRTPEELGWLRALVFSGVAAATMGGLFLAEFSLGPRVRSARIRRALSLSYIPMALLVMLLFLASGTLDFPSDTPFLKNHDPITRRRWIWKDLVIVYPLVLVFFSVFWRVTRADALAAALRRAGLLWAARDAIHEANDAIGRAIKSGYPHLATSYVIVNAALLAYDFFWYGQVPNKTIYTWAMLAHIVFQVGWGFLWFGFAGLHLRASQARLGGASTTLE